MIIGLVSHYSAGKDTVADYLVKLGFQHISLSDGIREELKNRHLPENRDNLINIANEMRKKFGNDHWAKKAFEKVINSNQNVVFSSIRNPVEAQYLMKQPNFILIKIDCPIEIRYKRLKKRDRIGDIKSLKEFIAKEKREESSDPSKQQIHKVVKMADESIGNSGTLENLYKNIDALLIKLEGQTAPDMPDGKSWRAGRNKNAEK